MLSPKVKAVVCFFVCKTAQLIYIFAMKRAGRQIRTCQADRRGSAYFPWSCGKNCIGISVSPASLRRQDQCHKAAQQLMTGEIIVGRFADRAG